MINYDQFEKGLGGLFETRLTDLFPLSSTEIRCLSYAVYQSMQQIRKFSERLCLHANIENLPESVLDYLAKEKNLPYYDSEFSIDTKRQLIEEGESWYFRAGTVDGVEKLIQILFGNASLVEWFDFEEDEREEYRGYFDVMINGTLVSDEAVTEFTKILAKAKNVSRLLRKVSANCDTEQLIFFINKTSLGDGIIIENEVTE